MMPMPEMTPRRDHAAHRPIRMLYSRSEDVRSAAAPITNIKGLNTIHATPDGTDFQLTAVRGPTGAVATIRLSVGWRPRARKAMRLAKSGQSDLKRKSS